MTGLLNLSTAKLKRIISLKQQIEKLSAKLETLAGGSSAPVGRPPKKKWTMSASARAKIAAAQRARWAKAKGAAKPAKKKRTMSAAARAKIAAAAKARWAKVRAAKKSNPRLAGRIEFSRRVVTAASFHDSRCSGAQ